MAVVALITTGRLEHAALDGSLQRLFPAHHFVKRPSERHLDGFTTSDVSSLVGNLDGPVPTTLEELVAATIHAIFPGRRDERIDYAFAIDDLELCNDAHPELVFGLFRQTAERLIERDWGTATRRLQDDVRSAIRERCSFHLFRPMTEAYFYGEPASVRRAGGQREPVLPAQPDLEQFTSADAEYLALPAGTDDIPDAPLRSRHPKAYLRFLCDPTGVDRKRRYRETKGGVAALRTLDWRQAVAGPPHCPFLHALLDDLGQALASPLDFVDPAHSDPRARFPGPQGRVLRNL